MVNLEDMVVAEGVPLTAGSAALPPLHESASGGMDTSAQQQQQQDKKDKKKKQKEEALAETLRKAKDRGITTVVVTQRPSLLQCVDKVLVLRHARMEAFGRPADVLHRVVPGKPAAPEAQPGRTGTA